MEKTFTVLEIEGPLIYIIGTFKKVENSEAGLENFKAKLYNVLTGHFGFEDFNIDEMPDLFVGEEYYDIGIEADGLNYNIRIIETFIF